MRAGIIGCGAISEVHAKSIRALGGIELAAMADCAPGKAKRMTSVYGGGFYTDWVEMLDKERPDIVHLCTPHYLHAQMAAECLERGIHVFTEKPPVISWEQLERLKETVRRQKPGKRARLGVCFQNRWNPEVQYAKRALEEGTLGRVIGAKGIVTWCRSRQYYESGEWRGKKATEGGGALINQGIHTLDLIQYLVAERAETVEALMGNFHLKDVIEVEDTVCAYIGYPRCVASLYVTTGYAADVPPIVEILCEGGSLRLEDGKVFLKRDGGETETIAFSGKKGYGKEYWGAGHQKAIGQFYKSIESGVPDLLDFDNVEETLGLFLRIYDAARPH